MVDAWPSTLPQCFPLDGFNEGMADNLLRSQPDAGPAKLRPRSSSQVRPVAATIIVNRTQWETLKTFVKTTLIQGSLPFTLPAQTESGSWLVRFTQMPTISRIGGKFRVALQFEILP